MAYGISACITGGLPFEQAVEKVAAAGFRQIELGTDGPFGQWQKDPVRAREALDAVGLVARTVHSSSVGWGNGSVDDAERAASIEAAAACFAPAIAIGAPIVICHSNSPKRPFTAEDYAASRIRSMKSLAVLAERAAAAGARIAIENLPARKQPRPGASIEQLLEMIAGLGEHVGLCLDAGHANANGLSAAAEARRAGAKLFAVHIQDCDGLGEDQHLIPGRGTVDWDGFLRALDEVAPGCVRTIEVTATNENRDAVLETLADLRTKWEAR